MMRALLLTDVQRRRALGTSRDTHALPCRHVAEEYSAFIGAVFFAILLGVALPWVGLIALKIGAVTKVASNADLRAVHTVAYKRCGPIGVESSTLRAGDVTRVDDVLAAPST